MAERIQLSRRKGWKMPPNCVKVTRPGIYGNPFIVSPKARPGARSGGEYICCPTVEDAVACHAEWVRQEKNEYFRAHIKKELRGKDLACWCRLGGPCHADILLEIANA